MAMIHSINEETPHVTDSPKPKEICWKSTPIRPTVHYMQHKECYITVGNGKNQKKEKADFKWFECDMFISWFQSICQDFQGRKC